MKIMGILNVTPDSFSDGGEHASRDAALAHARTMIDDGATIIDVGGESTRPGFTPLTADEEWERVGSVIAGLGEFDEVRSGKVHISVDTYHASTATRAAQAGAHVINDVTGGLGDPQMFSAVADAGIDYVLQHTRGELSSMDERARYDDVVAEVRSELTERMEAAIAAGIDRDRIILDPGLGFAKVGQQNWDVVAGIDAIVGLGQRVLVGASRKRFIADLAGTELADRDVATAATSSFLARHGVWAVRVHNVAATAVVLRTQEKVEGR